MVFFLVQPPIIAIQARFAPLTRDSSNVPSLHAWCGISGAFLLLPILFCAHLNILVSSAFRAQLWLGNNVFRGSSKWPTPFCVVLNTLVSMPLAPLFMVRSAHHIVVQRLPLPLRVDSLICMGTALGQCLLRKVDDVGFIGETPQGLYQRSDFFLAVHRYNPRLELPEGWWKFGKSN